MLVICASAHRCQGCSSGEKCFSLVASLPTFIPTFGILFIPTPLQDVKLKAAFKLLVGLVEDSLRIEMKICFSLQFTVYL